MLRQDNRSGRSSSLMIRRLEIGFQLDQLWHALRDEMDATKRPALVALGRVLRDARILYAIVGGIALEVH